MAIILNGITHLLTTASFGAFRPAAYSISGWFKASVGASSATANILSMVGSSSPRGDLMLYWSNPTATRISRSVLHVTGSTFVSTATEGSTIANVWTHRAAVYTGSQLLFYENGVLVGAALNTSTTAPVPANWQHTIGSLGSSQRFQGKAAMQAYYDTGLTAADVKSLSKYSPEMVRPQNLRSFFPGLRDAKNLVAPAGSASNLTFDNDNPPIIT